MTAYQAATSTSESTDDAGDTLAEVVELPVEAPSFYQRNGRSLPRSGQRATDAQRRRNLPTVTYQDDSLLDRLRGFLGL